MGVQDHTVVLYVFLETSILFSTVAVPVDIPMQLNFLVFILHAAGEGNGSPRQYSRLKNPMDRGAWWAAVQGVTKSWT